MYKQIIALFAIIGIASAGLIGAPLIGVGGLSYTQRLQGYGPILGAVGVAPVIGVGHVGHLGHLGHVGHLGVGHVGLGHVGHVGHLGGVGVIG